MECSHRIGVLLSYIDPNGCTPFPDVLEAESHQMCHRGD